jgi:hypothetical protein
MADPESAVTFGLGRLTEPGRRREFPGPQPLGGWATLAACGGDTSEHVSGRGGRITPVEPDR